MDSEHLKQEIQKDPFLERLSRLAKKENFPLYLVGGYIRDLLIGLHRKDYDFALPGGDPLLIPALEEALGFRFFKVGKEEKEAVTYRIVREGLSIDCAFLQGKTIEEDLRRRDFTVNAMAFSLKDDTFHWAPGSLEDIDRKILRSVSNRSIDEDPLRMLRAVRYFCVIDGFSIESSLKEEITTKSDRIRGIPGERVKTELDHLLLSPRPGTGVAMLYETGLLLALFPELKGLENLNQNGYHHLNVLPHTLGVIENIAWATGWITSQGRAVSLAEEDRLSVLYSALFHDIGKQDTCSQDETGAIHFYHHESFSAQAADRIMERLRFSNSMKNKVLRLVQNHMRILNLSDQTKETALRKLVHQAGTETPLLVILSLGDKEASRGIRSIETDGVVQKHCLHILDLFQQKEIVHPPPLITGHDIMALGYSHGPRVGEILDFIREKQIVGEIRTREEALMILREQFALE
jgi:putative nucleotidyltransferase with HDIG domain